MKGLDRYLQKWRNKLVCRYIDNNDYVLDIGSVNGVLFELLGDSIKGVGIDPTLPKSIQRKNYILISGKFPKDLPQHLNCFDVITLLAVIEHIPAPEIKDFLEACIKRLNPGGKLIITVPSKYVDNILQLLRFLRIIEGMSLEEHHHFEPGYLSDYFSTQPVILKVHKKFQMGLNNLFVYIKERR